MHVPIAGYVHANYPNGNVTQWFGLNGALYGSICYPDQKVPGGKYCLAGHNGIDIVAPWGTPLLAVCDGVIGDVKYSPDGYGKHLRLYREEDGIVEEWTYGHCSEILVKNGDEVKAGQVLAKMGNTGFVVSGATPYWKYNPYAGTHLHLGKRNWRLWDGTGSFNSIIAGRFKLTEAINYYNGFYGSIDFSKQLADAVGQVDTAEAVTKRLTLNSLYNQLSSVFLQQRSA